MNDKIIITDDTPNQESLVKKILETTPPVETITPKEANYAGFGPMSGKANIEMPKAPDVQFAGTATTETNGPLANLMARLKGNRNKKGPQKTIGAFGSGRKHNGVSGWKRNSKTK